MVKSFVFVGDTAVGQALAINLIEAGFEAAPDAGTADVILTFCASQSATEDVYFETGGLIQQAKKNAYLIDLGATSPTLAKELIAVALVNDLHAIDAPLYVGDIVAPDAYARRANLSMFVGGQRDDFDALKVLLEALASSVVYCGQAGAGQMAKALLSLQNTAEVLSLVEAYALCRESACDVAAVFAAAHTAGALAPRSVALYEAVVQRNFSGGYTLHMFMAELVAALSAADDVDLILPQAEAAVHLIDLLAIIGGGDMNPAALSLVYAEEAECAKHGLDWTRAEEAYAQGCDCDCEDDDCDCGCEHDGEAGEGEFPRGFGGYSAN
ncbi:MAG: NAD(P)-binding domain-containing protein [Raoultibacter sp.]